LHPLELPISLQKAGLWQVTPELKLSQSRRAVELNCAEKAFKQSFTLKADCSFAWTNQICNRILGANYGIGTTSDSEGRLKV